MRFVVSLFFLSIYFLCSLYLIFLLLYDEGRYFLILSVWCHKCFLYLDWHLLSSSWEIFHYDYFFSITTIFKMLSLALDWALSYQLSVYLVFSKCPTYLDASWYLISLSLSLLDYSSSFTFSPGCVSLIFFDPFCKWDFIQFFIWSVILFISRVLDHFPPCFYLLSSCFIFSSSFILFTCSILVQELFALLSFSICIII